jgi:hypothetical protein
LFFSFFLFPFSLFFPLLFPLLYLSIRPYPSATRGPDPSSHRRWRLRLASALTAEIRPAQATSTDTTTPAGVGACSTPPPRLHLGKRLRRGLRPRPPRRRRFAPPPPTTPPPPTPAPLLRLACTSAGASCLGRRLRPASAAASSASAPLPPPPSCRRPLRHRQPRAPPEGNGGKRGAEPGGATKSWLRLPFGSREVLQGQLHPWSRCKINRLGGLRLEPPPEPEPEPSQTGP